MHIIETLSWRYATKKFDANRFLSDEQIQILKEAFNLTATSYGLQPIRLVVLQNKEVQEQLVAHSWNQRQVADASHVLILCVDSTINTKTIESYFERVKAIRETPDEILAPFRDFLIDAFSKKSAEELKTWATKQAYIALGNLLNVCAIEKIDACPMEGFIPEKYDEILKLTDHGLSSVLVLPVGYRAQDDMFATFKKVRKTITESVIEMY